ncbi:phenylacrylic acid decarboxylase PAD1 [Saccharomyces cerevisiae]|nr:hypothetical protein QO155_001380 [Saccharomyces cerevisiae]
MFSRWMEDKGVSRVTSSNLRFSLIETSAALVIKSSVKPILIAASDFMEQGTTIIPSCWKDPDEMHAETSRTEYVLVAKAATSCGSQSVSYFIVAAPHFEITKWVSTLNSFSTCRSLIPSATPVAPVIATTILFGLGGEVDTLVTSFDSLYVRKDGEVVMVLPSKGKLAKMPVVLKKAILVLLGNRSISTQLKLLNALDSVD